MNLLQLPRQVIQELALKMGLSDLFNLIQVNRYLNRLFQEDDNFWRIKYQQEFGKITEKIYPTWREEYKSVGDVYVFGDNIRLQLGLYTPGTTMVVEPTLLPEIKAKAVSAGSYHTLLIDPQNRVMSFGFNIYGQLGIGLDFLESRVTYIFEQARAVSGGDDHSLILGLDYSVWAFGSNSNGQLGLGEVGYVDKPTQIPDLKARAISAGGDHSLVIDLEGSVWVFGRNSMGQLGLDDRLPRRIPTKIPNLRARNVFAGKDHSVIITYDYSVLIFGEGIDTRNICFKLRSNYASLSSRMSMFIDLDRTVWAVGKVPSTLFDSGGTTRHVDIPVAIPIKAEDVSIRDYHGLIVDFRGKIWGYGYNYQGELGLGMDKVVARLTQIPNLRARSVSTGDKHTVVIGFAYTFPPEPSSREVTRPIRVGDFVCAPSRCFKILSISDEIQLGDVIHPQIVESMYFDGKEWRIEGLESQEVVFKTPEEFLGKITSSLYVFGDNTYRQIGLYDVPKRFIPTQLKGIREPCLVSAGYTHSLVAKRKGLYSFGSNQHGELCQLSVSNSIEAISISTGDSYSIYITSDSKIISCGDSLYKEIDRSGIKGLKVSAGQAHVLIIDTDNNVWVFGDNSAGQLGLGDRENRHSPVALGIKGVKVSAGRRHSAVIDQDLKLWVFGQIGSELIDTPRLVSHSNKIIDVSAGGEHTVFINYDGEMWGFGNNRHGQLGLGENITWVDQPAQIPGKYFYVSAGGKHTMAIDYSFNLWAFGDNSSGQLGLGDNSDRFVPTRVLGLKALDVSAGDKHTLVIPYNPE